ncbi:MAG: PIN domain-containing protein [Bacteroidetes bacterium]|nr:PIN domain-containing protein [Bacteroidota bacterium]
MKIFLDANILVSVLNNEYPLFTYSARVLSLMDNRKFEVYTSPLCMAIAYYFAEKKSGNKIALQKIRLLSSKIKIAGITEANVKSAAENVKIHDFEDGIQYYSALQAKCTCLITENTEDFYFSEMEVLDAKSFLEKTFVK